MSVIFFSVNVSEIRLVIFDSDKFYIVICFSPETRFADEFDPRHTDAHQVRRDEDIRRSILKRTNQSRSFDRDDVSNRMRALLSKLVTRNPLEKMHVLTKLLFKNFGKV